MFPSVPCLRIPHLDFFPVWETPLRGLCPLSAPSLPPEPMGERQSRVLWETEAGLGAPAWPGFSPSASVWALFPRPRRMGERADRRERALQPGLDPGLSFSACLPSPWAEICTGSLRPSRVGNDARSPSPAPPPPPPPRGSSRRPWGSARGLCGLWERHVQPSPVLPCGRRSLWERQSRLCVGVCVCEEGSGAARHAGRRPPVIRPSVRPQPFPVDSEAAAPPPARARWGPLGSASAWGVFCGRGDGRGSVVPGPLAGAAARVSP